MSPPPAARRVPHRLELHGDVRIDDYYWLRDITGPEAQAHLAAEAAYAAAVTRRLGPLRDALAAEMTARGPAAPDPPVLENGYWYYSRPGDQYPTHLRRKDAPGAAEEVVLDLDEVAGGSSYLDVGDWKVSDDGSRLAFTADRTGSGDYELTVRELPSGRVVESGTPAAAPVAWAADGRTLFYLTQDATRRENRVWRRAVGQSAADDLVYEEADESYWLELSRSRDGRYLFHTSTGYAGSEQRYLPADRPDGVWQTILPRRAGHEYDADHRAGRFYLRTNEDAPNFRVVTCPVGRADPAGWAELVPHDPAVCVERLTLFRDFAVVADRADARPGLRVIDLETGAGRRVEVPGAVYDLTVLPTGFDDRTTRTEYSSPVVRPTGFAFGPESGGPTPVVPTGYRAERTYATAPDGARVPVSVVARAGLPRDGSAACLLRGYGAYGLPTRTGFDPATLALLDRGVVCAWACVRGGGDLGRGWYEAGRLAAKPTSITDFIACANHLVSAGYCGRDRLAVEGHSAGGLLVAAALNRRPDLCRAAVLRSPFVDVLTTMSDPTLPLVGPEYRQWGDPRRETDYRFLKGYCPYTNLRPAAYPAVLVTAALADGWVPCHEPAKYAAKLRAVTTGPGPVLLACFPDAGHHGAPGRRNRYDEPAVAAAFVLDQVARGGP